MTHHQILPEENVGACGPGLEELPKISGFIPFNIFATADSKFQFGTQLGFAKAHHKITPREKVDVALSYGSSQNFGVAL